MIRFPAPLSVHRRRSGHNHSSGHWGSASGCAGGIRAVPVPSSPRSRTPEVLQRPERRRGRGRGAREESEQKHTLKHFIFKRKGKRGGARMAGAIIENMSTKKLCIVGGILLVFQVIAFLVGGLIGKCQSCKLFPLSLFSGPFPLCLSGYLLQYHCLASMI